VPLFLVVWLGELTQQVAEGSRESSAPHFYVQIPPTWHSRAKQDTKYFELPIVLQGRTMAASQTESACNYLQQYNYEMPIINSSVLL
jgi:hypothetical protein